MDRTTVDWTALALGPFALGAFQEEGKLARLLQSGDKIASAELLTTSFRTADPQAALGER